MASVLEKQLKTLISSTGILHEQLENDRTALANPSVQLQINDLITLAEKCAKGRASLQPKEEDEDLDRRGTELWNLSTKLIRDDSTPADEQLLKLRHLGYVLLDSAQKTIGRSSSICQRLLKLANKAAKFSLDFKDITRAESLLGNSAKYEADLSKLAEQGSLIEDVQYHRAIGEYWTLRIALSWAQKNAPIAEYSFGKATASNLQKSFDVQSVERLCDVLFNIGKSYLEEDFESAATWFKRAFDLIESHKASETQFERLQFSIMQGLVQAYIAAGKLPGNDCSRARNVVDMMLQKWPARIDVHYLNIELASAENDSSMHIQDAIKAMINMMSVTNDSFLMVIQRILELRKKDCKAACECIDFLIKTKLLDQDNEFWTEQAFTNLMWMVVGMSQRPNEDDGLSKLHELIEDMSRCLAKPLGPKATYSSHVLLWKKSEVLINQGNYGGALNWCKVALHPIFDQKGELNRCKLARRIIACAIEAQQYGAAHEVYQGMTAACQSAAVTQFLMFKLALRSSKVELAVTSLRALQENHDTDFLVLYACALEAQESFHKDLTAQVFQTVLNKLMTSPGAETTQIPVLLRCTIRVIMERVQDTKLAAPADISTLCELFEKGASEAKRPRSNRGPLFSHQELDWFSRNAYNLAIKACDEWEPIFGLRFAESCFTYINSYSAADVGAQSMVELNLRNAFCNYLCASVCTVLARKEDRIDEQAQRYKKVRVYVASFRERRLDLQGDLPDQVEPDFDKKLSTLVCYDYEACAHLHNWGEMDKIIKEAILLQRGEVFEALADITLCSKAEPHIVMTLLKNILDASWKMQPVAKSKSARWIRCLIQLSMVSDTAMTERLVQQVIAMCGDRDSEPYPKDELEWLTATLWNFAIDTNCIGDLVGSKKWAEYALSLAGLLNDAGNMQRYMQEKFMTMKF